MDIQTRNQPTLLRGLLERRVLTVPKVLKLAWQFMPAIVWGHRVQVNFLPDKRKQLCRHTIKNKGEIEWSENVFAFSALGIDEGYMRWPMLNYQIQLQQIAKSKNACKKLIIKKSNRKCKCNQLFAGPCSNLGFWTVPNTSESSERPLLLLPPAYFSPGLFLVILESYEISPLSIFMAAVWMNQTSCGTMSFRFACHGWSNKGQNA